MNPLASLTRRVLGQKDPNAPLLSPSPKKTQDSHPIASPVRERSNLKRPVSPVSSVPSSPRAGQKRKIQETPDDLLLDSQNSSFSHHPLSQMTGMWSDRSSEDASSPPMSMGLTRSTPHTASTSFQASQEDSQVIEAQFVIHDEPSQRTLDKMHAVALPQSTSQLIPPLRPNLVQEASQISLSLSSLIDFENDEDREEDKMDFIDETSPLPKQRPQTEAETRKEMMLEKAETLRTRLQLAIFKVQTNQVTKPFARLNVPKTKSPSPEVRFHSSSPRSSSTIKARSVYHEEMSPETRVARARARATMQGKPTVRHLSQIPFPTIVPTTYTARFAEPALQTERHESSHEAKLDLPSSPPSSQGGSDDNKLSSTVEELPATEPKTPVQLSSPVSNADRGSDQGSVTSIKRAISTQHHRLREGGLTSSVVKGQAANGLLELMRGAGGTENATARYDGTGMRS